MEIPGKYVILFIGTAALAAAVFAWTFQYQRGRRILALWGADNARLIRVDAKQITLLELSTENVVDSESLTIDGETHFITRRLDITKARGIIHARQALIEDGSFQWDRPRGDCNAHWQYALRFTQGPRQATVLFDTNCQRAKLLESGSQAAIVPKIFEGWLKFIDEQIPETSNDGTASPTT